MEENKVFSQEFLSSYLHEHKDEMFEDLGYTVSFPSVKSAPEENAPFGRACAECLRACTDLYAKYGFETEIREDLGYGLAYYGPKPTGDDEYMAVIVHTDVVPVTPEEWTLTEPFRMLDAGENVVGRGVSDNKHGVVGTLYILRAMKACGYKPKHTICVVLGSNEESGMKDVKNFKATFRPQPKVCIVPDGDFPVSFGERGGFHADIITKETPVDILSVNGGMAYNIVLAKLDCTLRNIPGLEKYIESNPADWLVCEKAGDTLKLTATGIPCHGSRPYKGDSAYRRLVTYLAGFDGFCETDAHILRESASMLSDVYGISYGIQNDDPFMGKLTAANGKVFMKDGKIVFTLDIRFGPGVDKDAYKKTFAESVAARGFDCTVTKGSTSFRIDPENPLAAAILNSYRRTSGKPDANYFYMGGGTYSKIMNPESVSFSTGAFSGEFRKRMQLPSGHGGVHESDETAGKEELVKGLAILGMMFADVDLAY